MTRPLALLLLAAALAGGCRTAAPPPEADPDEVFGHRFETADPAGRAVATLQAPPPGEEHFVFAAVLSDVRIRQGDPDEAGRRPVELILFGALPDACTELLRVDEVHMGRMLHVRLEIWRPQGAICAQVVRRYRFYHELRAPLEPGAYVLHLNHKVVPFQVWPPGEGR